MLEWLARQYTHSTRDVWAQRLPPPYEELVAAFREAATKGFDVVIDYLWGAPTEALLKALTRAEFAATGP